MIRKLLIANRGEIARRIIRSAHKMGIYTVAIYESEDALSPYVREANAAFEIPTGFLDQDALLSLCQKEKIDAIHPGYGFLSENAAFVHKVEDQGIIFIGPSSDAMKRMGDKTAARLEAKAAGVPLLPGREIDDASTLASSERRAVIDAVGLPIVLKAAAGGGGKAQAIIRDISEIDDAFDKVLREAKRLYQSQALVVERYLEKARHVEVQILGNAAKENFALFDRDCSAQRNNQKIIEEAPAPHLPNTVRLTLHASAVRLANHVGYTNAGTMEYLYDSARQECYFLEMNTRLQVEHTVTEMITGLDLVYEQIRIAEGARTDYSTVKAFGHAIEARICAEKSDGSYQPSTGVITQYIEPKEQPPVACEPGASDRQGGRQMATGTMPSMLPAVRLGSHEEQPPVACEPGASMRLESGVELGSRVSGKYDNMIAKLIVHAENRDAARVFLHAKLTEFIINGLHTNIPLVKALLLDSKFAAVEHYTRYLQREFTPPQNDVEETATVAALLLYEIERNESTTRIDTILETHKQRV